MPFCKGPWGGAGGGLGSSTRLGIGFASSAAAMVQHDVRQAGYSLGFKSGDGAFQLRLGAEMGARPAVLTVRAEIIIVVRIIPHGKTATGRFLRNREPDAIDSIATRDVF